MAGRPAKFSTVAALLSAALTLHASPGALDVLEPDLVLTPAERQRLNGGTPVVRVNAGSDGYLSLVGIVRMDVTPERLIRWSASVEVLQKGKYVPEIGRFSMPPRIEDLAGLRVERDDLAALPRCRPGDCGVKLNAAEMMALAGAPSDGELGLRFRRMLVRRAADYLASGDTCALPYYDHREPVGLAPSFEALVQRLVFFPRALGGYLEYLRTFPSAGPALVEQSFLYWSKETLGMKPIISITHFSAARFDTPGMPEAVVVAKQIYASHYRNASVTVTALVSDGHARYLVYFNHSHVDAFRGFFGGMVRRIVERRVKAEAPGVLLNLRKRLESGDPPGTNVAPPLLEQR